MSMTRMELLQRRMTAGSKQHKATAGVPDGRLFLIEKKGIVENAYTEFTREVIQCGEKQRNKHESSLSR